MVSATAVAQQTAAQQDDVILHASQITKHYPGTVALDKVDFNIYRGKVNALIGENGAGKSTLMKILAGAVQATSGTLLLESQPVEIESIFDAEGYGIGIIHQELNLFPNLSIAENIFMAHELTNRLQVVQHGEQNAIAAQLMDRLEHPIEPATLVSDLRIGQQQIVEIAKALAQDIRILIMDEPTSALSTSEVEVLFRVIEELKSQGVSIVYISHKLDEVMHISDYVTVLRDGHLIAEAPTAEIDLGWIVEKMVGRDTTRSYQPPEHAYGDEILRVEQLSLPRAAGGYVLQDINISLRAGEILGIYGLMGAGRTELFESLMGLHSQITGDIWVNGQHIRGKNVRSQPLSQRIETGIMLIPEDRQRDGLVQKLSVADNMLLASLKNYLGRFALSRQKEEASVNRLIKELAIKVPGPEVLITSLSGGNQQKVVVAKALLTSPKVLLMDEPTRGIDVGAKEEIFDIMTQLAAQGIGIIFVSSELKEVLQMADRVITMSRGRITQVFERPDITEEALVEASFIGHDTVKTGD